MDAYVSFCLFLEGLPANCFGHRGFNWISSPLIQCCQITGPGLASGAKTLASRCCCEPMTVMVPGGYFFNSLVKSGWISPLWDVNIYLITANIYLINNEISIPNSN